MVMAAGVGSRLDPLTKNTPKPLVPVVNKPVMDILLDKLKSFGVESVIANTHYLGNEIQERYTKNSPVDIEFNSIFEETLSGTAGGVKKCEFFFKDVEDFMVVSADGLHDADLERIVSSHFESGCIATMAVIPVDMSEVSHYGVVVSSPEHLVTEFQEKPPVNEAKSNYINTGIYVFNKKIFDFIPANTKFDFAKDVFPALMNAGEKINSYRIYSYWSDIGTLEQYKQSNFDALANKIMIEDARIINKYNIRYVAGKNTQIHDSVELLGDCVIGNNCKIGKNVKMKNAILWDNVVVNEDVTLDNCVIANDCTINCSVKNEVIGASRVLETSCT